MFYKGISFSIHTKTKTKTNKNTIGVRRPHTIGICIITYSISTIVCSFVSLLHNQNVLSLGFYLTLAKIVTYFGIIPLSGLRMWFLFYDLKTNRIKQKKLLSKYLLNHTNVQTGNIFGSVPSHHKLERDKSRLSAAHLSQRNRSASAQVTGSTNDCLSIITNTNILGHTSKMMTCLLGLTLLITLIMHRLH